MMDRPKIKSFIKSSIIFFTGCAFGWAISNAVFTRAQSLEQREVRLENDYSSHSLTNPLLQCEQYVSPQLSFAILKRELNKYIAEQRKKGTVRNISVYVRDLNNGPWIGIGEHDDFAPASLLKIPIMVAYYKIAETEPEILSQTIFYDPAALSSPIPQNVPASSKLKPKQYYTVEELIRQMIAFSDNSAKNLLALSIDANILNQTFLDLQLVVSGVRGSEDFISVKEYASVFRILYNASYLSRPLSEKALKLLTESEFSEGIKAGLPSDIVVAHKFGEREDSSEVKQLHECAIVYIPKRPYLLCIMTKGNNISSLKTILKDISQLVYRYRMSNP
jgi:beta-lactamase class A